MRPALEPFPFDCNEPTVVGYSVCWAGSIITIRTHRNVGEQSTFYKDLDICHSRAVWVYMPVEDGERISEIWVRDGEQRVHMGIMLRTDRGRHTMIALAMSPRLRMQNKNVEPEWRQMCRLPKTPTRVYFNLSNRGIFRLAIERPIVHRQGVASSPWYSHNIVDYFYSDATLEGVVQVTPCRRELAT